MSSGMNSLLAEIYGTPGAEKTASAAEPTAEKVAQATEFLKAAAANGIDTDKLTDDQLVALWNATFDKAAGELPPQFAAKSEEKGEEKKEEAPAKSEEKKDEKAEKEASEKIAQEKLAEADTMGRVMAHAYVQEMRKIAEAGGLPPWMAGKDEGGEEKKDEKKEAPKAEEKKEEEKKASAESQLNEAAFVRALEQVKEAGLDLEEAASRMRAAYLLANGAVDGAKVASAASPEMAVEIRSLELLEMAGYPIQWKI